jgi:hypothetical protein
MINTILEHRHSGIWPTKRFEPTGSTFDLVRLSSEKNPIDRLKPVRLQNGVNWGFYFAKFAFD